MAVVVVVARLSWSRAWARGSLERQLLTVAGFAAPVASRPATTTH